MNLVVNENGMVNLNHIAKMAGAPHSKAPGKWLRNARTKELIMHLLCINPRGVNLHHGENQQHTKVDPLNNNVIKVVSEGMNKGT